MKMVSDQGVEPGQIWTVEWLSPGAIAFVVNYDGGLPYAFDCDCGATFQVIYFSMWDDCGFERFEYETVCSCAFQGEKQIGNVQDVLKWDYQGRVHKKKQIDK